MSSKEIILYGVAMVFVIISILIFTGKGGFLIAGFNTMSEDQRNSVNQKRLKIISGSGSLLIGIMIAADTFLGVNMPGFLDWLLPWGVIIVSALMVVLLNVLCRKKQ